MRWQDAERGIVGPDEFIPLAEDAGLIEAIGGWVLHAVCAQVRAWEDAGLDAHVHVNVSPRQLRRPDFPTTVREALRPIGSTPRVLDAGDHRVGRDARRRARQPGRAGAARRRRARSRSTTSAPGYSSLLRLRDVPVEC